MIFSKRYILFIATVIILFAVISEGGVAGQPTPVLTKTGFWSWAFDKIREWTDDGRTKTEATSSATCVQCLVNQAALDKRHGETVRGLASDIHKVTVFCKDPNANGCGVDPRQDYTQELLKNPQLNAIVLVESSGKYIKLPAEDPRKSASKPVLGPDGKYHTGGIGFMINECLMLTNKHVAYMKSYKENIPDLEIKISQKRKGTDGSYGQIVTVKGKVVGEAIPALGRDKDLEDLVVVKLEKSSVDRKAFIPTCDMREVVAVQSKSVSLASFFPDKDPWGNTLTGQNSCKIYGKKKEAGDLWRTDCPTIEGTSGTPVLVTIMKGPDKGKLCSPGIIQGQQADQDYMESNPDTVYNVMIPFSEAMPKNKLEEIVSKHKCSETTYL